MKELKNKGLIRLRFAYVVFTHNRGLDGVKHTYLVAHRDNVAAIHSKVSSQATKNIKSPQYLNVLNHSIEKKGK